MILPGTITIKDNKIICQNPVVAQELLEQAVELNVSANIYTNTRLYCQYVVWNSERNLATVNHVRQSQSAIH